MSQIRVEEGNKSELDKLKGHPRETYDDVIKRLIKDNNPTYDNDFKEWLLDNMKRNHPKFKVLHITDCDAGLQVFSEMNPIILITHGELKMVKCLHDEGYEIGEKGYSLFDYQIFQMIDGKLR